jgi:hypothetical protein
MAKMTDDGQSGERRDRPARCRGLPGPFRPGDGSRPADRREIDVFWMVGGNFLETLSDPVATARALEHVRMRIHQDVLLSSWPAHRLIKTGMGGFLRGSSPPAAGTGG